MLTYILGVDVGTTYSAGAVARDGRAEIASIGTRTAAIPSVVVLHPHGEVLVGEAAERRSVSEPTRTAREFKRRLGDPVPLLLGGEPYGAEALMAHVLRHLVERVAELEGGPPAFTVMSHPANYGDYKLSLLQETVRLADVGEVRFVTEPEAAAIHYASLSRVGDGEVVAVYDFGGGTFDAAVVRKSSSGFSLMGMPEGMERFGGIDFDQAVFAHVVDSLGGVVSSLDGTDPGVLAALARLREECRLAKEALSTDTDVTIPVLLPNVQTDVRLTRSEFESMIRPRLAETTDALARTVASAGLAVSDLSRVLLVGGSSRIPLVADVVRSATGVPVAVDAHPKHAIALGAAASASSAATPAPTAGATTPAPPPVAEAAPASPVARPDPLAALAASAPATAKKRTPLVAAAVLLAVVVLAGAAFAFLGGGGDDDDDDAGGDEVAAASTTAPASSPGPTPAPAAAYPAGATDRFRDFCGSQGVPGPVCRCAVEGIQQDKTYPEFVAFEEAVYADPEGTLPDDVTAVFERCSAEND